MRRVVVVALVLGLLAGAVAAPADAKRKKKRKPPPITFEAEGTIAAGQPGTIDGAGITSNEFVNTCAIPATQGLDGYVIEVPDELSAVTATVSVTGSDAAGLHDLDMYFYDESCAATGAASTEVADEVGIMPAGTKYVAVSAFTGVQISFTLEAIELR